MRIYENISLWVSVETALPVLHDEDHRYIRNDRTREVLATTGKETQVAYLLVDVEERTCSWKIAGRDFYDFDGVTHWQELPSLPS
jgi:hypothetical protein